MVDVTNKIHAKSISYVLLCVQNNECLDHWLMKNNSNWMTNFQIVICSNWTEAELFTICFLTKHQMVSININFVEDLYEFGESGWYFSYKYATRICSPQLLKTPLLLTLHFSPILRNVQNVIRTYQRYCKSIAHCVRHQQKILLINDIREFLSYYLYTHAHAIVLVHNHCLDADIVMGCLI